MDKAQTTLAKQIARMYDPPLSELEANEAARNLTGFFETLIQIDLEQKKGKENADNRSADRLHQA